MRNAQRCVKEKEAIVKEKEAIVKEKEAMLKANADKMAQDQELITNLQAQLAMAKRLS